MAPPLPHAIMRIMGCHSCIILKGGTHMKYRIVGDTMPAVEIMFDSKGESVFTQSGGMTWMSDGIAMATNTRGGLMKGIGRMFAGESLFMATYTAQRPGALIAFASTVAGQISSGFFGGEGFILQDISGQGIAFLEVDGDLVEKQLAPGEILKVDTGNVVAFDRSVRYEIETVKGLGNIFFGGEGLFLTKLTGPGRVLLQTQNLAEFAGRVAQFVPTNN